MSFDKKIDEWYILVGLILYGFIKYLLGVSSVLSTGLGVAG